MFHILIIEDNPGIYYLLEMMLSERGYKVSLAGNLLEAEHHTNHNNFDLILLDLHLPDGHGYDFIHFLRQEHQAQTPLIVLSSNSQEDRIQGALDAGADSYIVKPLNIEEVADYVDQWVAQNVAH